MDKYDATLGATIITAIIGLVLFGVLPMWGSSKLEQPDPPPAVVYPEQKWSVAFDGIMVNTDTFTFSIGGETATVGHYVVRRSAIIFVRNNDEMREKQNNDN